MKKTEWIMGMPITIVIATSEERVDEYSRTQRPSDDATKGLPFIADQSATTQSKEKALAKAFEYFRYVDEKFSTYKEGSEISRINRGEIEPKDYSKDMKIVFALSEKTKHETGQYFDILTPEGTYDPSGLVKGWAIYNAAELLSDLGFKDFYVDAGGDIEIRGKNLTGEIWRVGIRDPFSKDPNRIVKTVFLTDCGMATSGTYIRGQHIYDPHKGRAALNDLASITVIGQNVYEADRFATAAFAMGKDGINFIEQTPGLEGYAISSDGVATMTSGFEKYTRNEIHR